MEMVFKTGFFVLRNRTGAHLLLFGHVSVLKKDKRIVRFHT
jgi:hypothetical protein